MTDHPGGKQTDSIVAETDRLNLPFSDVCTKDHSIRDRLKSIEVNLNLLIGAIPIITIILLKIVEHLFPDLK